MIKFPDPVKIENLDNPFANLYRNLNRVNVDSYFEEANESEIKAKNLAHNLKNDNAFHGSQKDYVNSLFDEVSYLRNKARQMWREIIVTSNEL